MTPEQKVKLRRLCEIATEEVTDTICGKCGDPYSLSEGRDIGPMCDWCAQEIAVELAHALPELLDKIDARDAEVKRWRQTVKDVGAQMMSNAEEIVRLRAMLVEQFEKDAEQFEKDAEQFEKDAEQFEKDVLTVIQYGSDR